MDHQLSKLNDLAITTHCPYAGYARGSVRSVGWESRRVWLAMRRVRLTLRVSPCSATRKVQFELKFEVEFIVVRVGVSCSNLSFLF